MQPVSEEEWETICGLGNPETVGRVRHAGATGQLTVRADSGFYAHALVVVCQ